MSEKNVLRNSLLGGYRKSDVIEYMDTVLDNSEKKVTELEEQIATLTRKNEELSSSAHPAPKPVLADKDEAAAETHDQLVFTHPSFEPTPVNNQSATSIRQQMNLPEGSYQVLEGNKMVHIPEPAPTYLTKGRYTAPEPVSPIPPTSSIPERESDTPAFQTKSEPQQSNRIHRPVVLTGNESFQPAAAKASEKANPNDGRRVVNERPSRVLENSLMARVKELAAELEKERQEKKELALELEFYQRIGVESQLENPLMAQVNALTAELEQERQEKSALAAKLEFTNDFLLQLYKK